MLLKTRLSSRNVLGNVSLTSSFSRSCQPVHELEYSLRMGEKVSHKHKCIFIHIPKTAGSSIREVLYGSIYGGSHATAREFQILFPEEFQSYYKFAVVRNPWERLVSAYAYFYKGGNNSDLDLVVQEKMKSLDGFEGWCDYLYEESLSKLRSLPIVPHFAPQTSFIADENRGVIVDSILRFENLQDDFEAVNNGLFSGVKLGRHRSTKHDNYRNYYNTKTRNLVEKIYFDDIELLKYEF